MENKKTITIIGIILLVVLLVIGCMVGGTESSDSSSKLSNDPQTIMTNAQKESNAVQEDEKAELNEITIDQYLDYYNGNEPKLVLVARPTCGYCQIAEPIIQKLVKDYNIELYYLNTDNLSGPDSARFTQSDEKFSSGFGTPMLLVVENKKIVDMVDGLTDTAHYIEFLKDNKFIK